MTDPGPTPPRKDPPPAALIGLGAVFLAVGVVFMSAFDGTIGTVASTASLLAGGMFMGLGIIRLLKSRRGGGG